MPSDRLPTDVVLLRLQGMPPHWDTLSQRLAATPICRELGGTVTRRAWSEPSGTGYVYLELAGRIALSRRALASLEYVADATTGVHVSRLALMLDLQGASRAHRASFHYVVEMTPQAGWSLELQRWYDSEHLPGLAGVPGCVRAQRFWNYDAGPQSLACYDLLNEDTLGSAAWLSVRHTAWSARMRPRFMDTVRTMFTLRP